MVIDAQFSCFVVLCCGLVPADYILIILTTSQTPQPNPLIAPTTSSMTQSRRPWANKSYKSTTHWWYFLYRNWRHLETIDEKLCFNLDDIDMLWTEKWRLITSCTMYGWSNMWLSAITTKNTAKHFQFKLCIIVWKPVTRIVSQWQTCIGAGGILL